MPAEAAGAATVCAVSEDVNREGMPAPALAWPARMRVGRRVERNLYVQVGEEPSDADQDVGRVDSAELAAFLVRAANAALGRGSQ